MALSVNRDAPRLVENPNLPFSQKKNKKERTKKERVKNKIKIK